MLRVAWLALLAACVAGPLPDSGRPPADGDRDGVADTDDCAPADPEIPSDGDGSCDGVDSDCDGIVDEDALYSALVDGRIAGAALDCFADEPPENPSRLAALDNVLLAPHAIAWTDELFRDIGRTACQGIVELLAGRRPRGVVNPEVFEKASFQEKWRRLREPV